MYQVSIKKFVKTHLKSIVLAIIVLFLLFNTAKAETIIYQENFNNPDDSYYISLGWNFQYVSGNKAGRCYVGNYWGCYYNGVENSSLLTFAQRGFSATSIYHNNNITANTIEFNFWSVDIETSERYVEIYIYGKNNNTNIEQVLLKLEGQENNILAYQYTAPLWYQLGNYWSVPNSNYLRIEFDEVANKFRIKFRNNDFTIWNNVINNFDFDYISKIDISDSWLSFWIDDFKIGGVAEFFSECGAGNYLQFCITQETCVAHSGYWYNDFCYEEQIDIIDFNNYYLEHSSFTTPTAFINSLAGFVSPFLQSAGNFLKTFKGNFDITQATAKGYLLGSAISQARGYLDLVNDFFGGLPVADMLLLFIIVIILIVVIRIVIKIIGIVKP